MKILISAHGFPPLIGGVQSQLYPIATELQKNGANVRVLTNKIEGSRNFDIKSSIQTYRIPGGLATYQRKPLISRMALYVISLLKELIQFKPSVIFSSTWQPYGPIIILLAKLFGFKTYFQVHGVEILSHKEGGIIHRIMLYTLENASGLFAMGSFQLNNLLKLGIREDKINVILDGVDPNRFKPNLNVSKIKNRHNLNNHRIILTVSNLHPHKGQDSIIKILPEISKDISNIKYLIVGLGPNYDNLKNLSIKYKVQDKVIFAGYVKDEELQLYYNVCDLFIMLSRETQGVNPGTEGYGLVFIEANACGKPTIGSLSGGIYDAVIDKKTGFLINAENSKEIVSKIKLILNDNSLSSTLGQNGRERVESELNYEFMAQKMLKIMSLSKTAIN